MNPNNLKITLVNPVFEREPPLVIMLSRDNVKQTVMKRYGSDEVLYNVESNLSMNKTSVLHPGNDSPVAIIEMKDLIGFDKVTFRGQKRQRIKDWIFGCSIFPSFPMSFQEDGKSYHWERNLAGQLALFKEHNSTNPIAWYERSKLRVTGGVLKGIRAFIALEDEAIQIQDTVVVSFLVIESLFR